MIHHADSCALPPPTTSEVAQPPVSPLLLEAGKLLFQNWQPILQVRRKFATLTILTHQQISSTKAGKALASAGGALGTAGAVATGAAGATLVTAGVAK